MRNLNKQEQAELLSFFEAAVKVAERSLCLRAHCGAVIVKDGKIIGEGYNSPPQNNPKFRMCLQEYEISAGFRHDRTCCVHAEQRAITDALKHGQDTKDAVIYFTRIDKDKNRIPSHRLCCTICSRAVLDAGIAEFVLEWEDGTVRSWPTEEFDKLSYQYQTPILD